MVKHGGVRDRRVCVVTDTLYIEGKTCNCFVKHGSLKPLEKVVLHKGHMKAGLLGG